VCITIIAVNSDLNGDIYFTKQPGGPYECFEARAYSGRGNNKVNREWGKSNGQLIRLGRANYPNRKSLMRKLPNARLISNQIVAQTTSKKNNKNLTDFLWIWGQFINHDISLTETATPAEAANITISEGDSFFPAGFISFSRTKYDPTTGSINERQQLTAQSAFIDSSNIYGTGSTRASNLRANDGTGRLATGAGNLLPKNSRFDTNIPNNHDPLYYLAGNTRVNEQLALLALHTVWVREHNRIADDIRSNNSQLTGGQIYQSARRKVAALVQAITFNEYLPALLGASAVPNYVKYDSTINSTIYNEFASCLYRFGHTLVSADLQRYDANLRTIAEGWARLRDSYYRPDRLTEGGGIEPLLRGAARQVCQAVDTHIVDDLRNYLFGNPGSGGFDLAALDIQRSRDHGVPSYNETRVLLGLSSRRSYSQISSDSAVIARLTSVYSNINEIDLYIGMLAEDHVAGSMVGETLQTGLLKQFLAVRDGDRFWYENIFTGSLLDEIKNTTLTAVIKRNTTIGSEIQDDVFRYLG